VVRAGFIRPVGQNEAAATAQDYTGGRVGNEAAPTVEG
jgi:hypothetical protein